MTTGELIKQARKNAKLTQKELGEKLGVSYQSIAQWENNLRNPKQETIFKIADALNITPFELLPDDIRTEFKIRLGASEENELRRVFDAKTNPGIESGAIDPVLLLVWYSDDFQEGEQYERAISYVKALAGYPPTDVDSRIASALNLLNQDGREKAAERAEELTEIPRYRRTDTPPTPPESTDTTPAAKPTEGPQEGG